jgi:undecaprenyl pyrophosphate phosphatase UppP
MGEFLPSAEDPGATFTAITQIGTELAVLVYFWGKIVRIISQWAKSLTGRVPRNDPDARMGWIVIIGTIPIGIAGYLFQDVIRDTFRNLWLVAIVLIVFGLLLGAADALGRRTRTEEDLTYGTASPSASRRCSRSSPASPARGRRRRWGWPSATPARRRRRWRSCSPCPPCSAAACTS